MNERRIGDKLAVEPESSLKSGLKSSLKTTDRILKVIAQYPMITREELAQWLNVSFAAIKKNIAQLKKAGKLRRIGPDKGGHWEVIRKD